MDMISLQGKFLWEKSGWIPKAGVMNTEWRSTKINFDADFNIFNHWKNSNKYKKFFFKYKLK
jgi:hypothetical protein